MKRRTFPVQRSGKSPYQKQGKSPYKYTACIPSAGHNCPPLGKWVRDPNGSQYFVRTRQREEARR